MSLFERWTDRDIVDLIDAQPLALVVSASGGIVASPLPILVETDDSGRPTTLIGHFARSNPQLEIVRRDPRCAFLFLGAHGYISPELVTATRDWAPTWNYAFANIAADVALDEEFNAAAIEQLVEKMEGGRPKPWSVAEMGARYAQLRAHVVAFRASIVDVRARFKLAQDERPEVLFDLLTGLTGSALAGWMERFNPGRAAR